jgi:hypothetical protein
MSYSREPQSGIRRTPSIQLLQDINYFRALQELIGRMILPRGEGKVLWNKRRSEEWSEKKGGKHGQANLWTSRWAGMDLPQGSMHGAAFLQVKRKGSPVMQMPASPKIAVNRSVTAFNSQKTSGYKTNHIGGHARSHNHEYIVSNFYGYFLP